MKKTILTLLLIFITFLVHSQSKYPLSVNIKKDSNWNLKIDTITAESFYHSKAHKFNFPKVNSDSILRSKAIEYKESITLTDSCCVLKGSNKTIELCNSRPKDDRQWTNFEFCFVENDYLIFYESGYEWWSYTIYNPLTREYANTSEFPIFINNDIFYSYGNYHTEGQFDLVDIKNNRYFKTDFFNWELKNLYRIKKTFYLELESNDSIQEYKYLSIKYD